MKFIIDFIDTATTQEIQDYFTVNNCVVEKEYSAFDSVYLIDAPSEPPVTELVTSVINNDASAISLLSTMSWSTSSMVDWWKVASALKPDLNAATISYPRPAVNSIMYMVDSGIQLSHPEFANARVENLFSFNGDFTDTNGHGTALTSVVVGESCGIVDARVKSVKIFQNGTPTLTSDLLSAFDAIVTDGNSLPGILKIVNLSWSIPKNEYIESKIQQLMDFGYVVVCSAGNNGTAIENITPASMPDVITVGAYDSDFNPSDFSNFTGYLSTAEGLVNYGALDVWAPGSDIRVAELDGTLAMTAGTSVASAIQCASILFNSQYFELSDGSMLEYFQAKSSLISSSVGKTGMLNLSGQHTDSVNKISVILTEKNGDNGTAIPKKSEITWVITSGVTLPGVLLFPKTRVTSYDASNLPTGLYMDNGFLLGALSVESEEVISVQVPVTYVDNTTENVTLKLVAVLPTTDRNDPALNQEVAITLNSDNLCNSAGNCAGGCIGTPGQPTCFNCAGLPKQTNPCQCIGAGGCVIN